MNMRRKTIKATYSFAVNGGAISDISLGITLPAGAIVVQVLHQEVTNATSGGSATVTINSKDVDDNKTALTGAIAVASFSGIVNEALASAADGVAIPVSGTVVATVAVATLTAGVINFIIDYYI